MTFSQSQSMVDMTAMLSTCRPHGTKAERRFIREWLEPLGVERDGMGNVIKKIGDSAVLWSSHTDTVHRAGGRQKIHIDSHGRIALTRGSKSNCLGADCSAGVWIMREMIQNEIPGLYVFHRGEEIGGLGSRYIASKTPELLDGIRYAIAFDRKGRDSVITHQGGKCASDEFAFAMASELNLYGKHFAYAPDDSGMFTDTANYVDLVPECTNISVGYENAHFSKETQDSSHLLALRDAIMYGAWDSLPAVRKLGDDGWSKEPAFDWHAWSDDQKPHNVKAPTFDLYGLVDDYPEETADLLDSLGVTGAELAEYVYAKTGFVRFGR